MRTRSIAVNHPFPYLALAIVALLAVLLAAPGGARAQQQPVAEVPATAATLIASIGKIEPNTVDLDRADDTSPPEDGTEYSAGATSQTNDVTSTQVTASVIVGEDLPAPEPDPWDGFRQSVVDAAKASCFDSHALAHQEFVVEGLLRLPFLVQAATDGTCR
jgi:hypothetical protein